MIRCTWFTRYGERIMSLAVNVQQAIDETPLPAGNDALIAPFCVVVRRAAREASTSVCIESGALATSAKVFRQHFG
ncbi:hypothetical protein AK812_SmicGene2431 [Symbiodinium microadriaticum]|uniref:Uncharacterized protein n=1 Tax=Symbiodinium microadriaticum TaxID=2951 RepID=A0A1Q9F1X4_SYMMI|nr:hypothetical protein AK812_SmicGene2431 [Symbiodinium microadriaticum]